MLKDQAKKMNVKSLATNKEDAGKSVEIRIAKVAFTIFFLFVCAWTPYAFVAMTGAFGDRLVWSSRQFSFTLVGIYLIITITSLSECFISAVRSCIQL